MSFKHAFDQAAAGIGQAFIAAIEAIGQAFVVEAEQMQDGRMNVVDVGAVVRRSQEMCMANSKFARILCPCRDLGRIRRCATWPSCFCIC